MTKSIGAQKTLLRRSIGAVAMSCAVHVAASGSYSRFEFDLRQDGQHAIMLDYVYKSGNRTLVAMDRDYVKMGQGFYVESAGLRGPRGTSLYAKWRDTKTNQVFEDTVDLQHRLPPDMQNKALTLLVEGPQLQLFVVSEDQARVEGSPLIGPSVDRRQSVAQIYP